MVRNTEDNQRLRSLIEKVIDEIHLPAACRMIVEGETELRQPATIALVNTVIASMQQQGLSSAAIQQAADRRSLLDRCVHDGADAAVAYAKREWAEVFRPNHQASYRNAKFYLAKLLAARERQMNSQNIIDQLFADWEQIRHAVVWLTEASQSRHTDATQLLSFIMNVGGSALELFLLPEEYRKWAELALGAAELLDNPETIILNTGHIGDSYLLAGYVDSAVKYYERALVIAARNPAHAKSHVIWLKRSLAMAKYRSTPSQAAVEAFEESIGADAPLNLLVNLVGMYVQRYEVEAAQRLATQIAPSVQANGDDRLLGLLNVYFGGICLQLDDIVQAEVHCRRGLDLLIEAHDENNAQVGYETMGHICVKRGAWADALVFHTRALNLAESKHLIDKQAIAHNNIASVYARQGRHEDALTHLEQALALFQSINDEANLKLIENSLSQELMTAGKQALDVQAFDQARIKYERALGFAQALSNQEQMMTCLNALGVVFDYQQNRAQARNHYQCALTIAQDLGKQTDIVNLLYNLGQLAIKDGQPREAIKRYEEGLILARKSKLTAQEGNLLASIGMAHASLQNRSKAEHYYRLAYDVFIESGDIVSAQRVKQL